MDQEEQEIRQLLFQTWPAPSRAITLVETYLAYRFGDWAVELYRTAHAKMPKAAAVDVLLAIKNVLFDQYDKRVQAKESAEAGTPF